ncbi:MAG TPA: acyltransferase [Bacteroidales bacterium]|nr:acyltransferase [Bacteroidales bacterium]
MKSRFSERIFDIRDDAAFSVIAMEELTYQYENNPVYRSFTDNLGKSPWNLKSLNEIPFLPIEFFRNLPVITGRVQVEMIFESSGTTGSQTGKHFVKELSLYEESFVRGFRLFYGDPENYIIIALLPSYTERGGSSLVYMVQKLIGLSNNDLSGFYRNNISDVINRIKDKKPAGRQILLIGVSFALLDLAEKTYPDLSGAIIMETGGMKGRRKELIRTELHSILIKRLNVDTIHSEYGMTELLSQAYSKGNGVFRCPPWMKILIRDPQDPLSIITEPGKTGGINVIDLANINSCSFIATSDLGKLHEDGSFEVLGRFDNSDIRGCNLMVE